MQIWFTPIPADQTFTIVGPQTYFTGTDPNYYTNEGYFECTIATAFCERTRCFKIVYDQTPNNDIDPLPIFDDLAIVNDTLTICTGDFTTISVVDLLTNPQQNINILPTAGVVTETFQITVNGSWVNVVQFPNYPSPPTYYKAKFYPQTTGWYALEYTLITGFNNACGTDTIIYTRYDSLYIIVNPLPVPSTQLSLSSLLCPGGSVYLEVSPTIPNFSWSGQNSNLIIDWVSPNGDSAQVSASGNYLYSGVYGDPLTGCSDSYSFMIYLQQKIPPTITMNPADGIVCPYDSVVMSLPSTYQTYNWTGPSGTTLSNTNTLIDEESGFYFCTVLDNEDCYLTTAPVQIIEYSTPYLMVEPTYVLCPGQQIAITAVLTGTGTINWLPPLSGSFMTQYVTSPGWYKAQMTSCGITTIDSVFIIDGSFTPSISSPQTELCPNEGVLITGNLPNYSYAWSNGVTGTNSITVGQVGTYYAIVTSDNGCAIPTNSLNFTNALGAYPPNSYTITLCEPANQTLQPNENLSTVWFDSNYNVLDTAYTYTDYFTNSVVIYAAYDQSLCPITYGTINIDVFYPIPITSEIFGDPVLCFGESATYTTNWGGDIEWEIVENFVSNDSSITLNSSNLMATNTLYATLSNACYSSVLTFDIQAQTYVNLTPSFLDTLVCPNGEISISFADPFVTMHDLNGNVWNYPSSLDFIVSQPTIYQFYAYNTVGCPTTDTVSIDVDVFYTDFEINAIHVPFCTPDTVSLTTNIGVPVLWSIGSSQFTTDVLVYPVLDADVFNFSALHYDALGCPNIDEISMTIFNPNVYNLGADTMVCIGEVLYTSYQVQYNNGLVFMPMDSVYVANSFTMTYVVNNNFGCPYIGQIQVDAINCDAEHPNVITPNGDGTNEFFVLLTAPMETNNHLIILNRWGNVVFESYGYNNTFNGQNCVDGVYFYRYIPNIDMPEVRVSRGTLNIIR